MNSQLLLPLIPLLPMAAAGLFPLLRRKKPATLLRLFAGLSVAFGILACLPLLSVKLPGLLQGSEATLPLGSVYGLRFTCGGFRSLYAAVCGFMFAMSALFSPAYFSHGEHHARYCFFNFLTFGATLGVFLSADLGSCFTCFELLSFCSAVWVAQEETRQALAAAKTYLAVSVLGGLLLFFGLTLLYSVTGTLSFRELAAGIAAADGAAIRGRLWISGICMLLGFGAKAGMFPLQIWLPKAHPVAPAPASALLSGILTKVGVFGVILVTAEVFAGDESLAVPMAWILLLAAAVTMFLGALLALFSVNLKRTLACSSMSQIGFILSGIGSFLVLHGEARDAAAAGCILHMLNHSLIKLVLFLAAGAVYEHLHTLELDELRGWGRKKPFLAGCFLLGALDIAGIPGFGGYLSKTLLHEALAEAGEHLGGIAPAFEWIFLLSGGLTLAYMTKLFICIFLQKHPTKQAEYDRESRTLGPAQGIALGLAALALLPVGLPSVAKRLAAFAAGIFRGSSGAVEGNLFSGECLLGIGISAAIGVAVYLGIVRPLLMKKGSYLDRWPRRLELETLVYLPLIRLLSRVGRGIASIPDSFGQHLDEITAVCSGIGCTLCRVADRLCDGFVAVLRRTVLRELPVKKEIPTAGKLRRAARNAALQEEANRFLDSFSFSMAAACIGIAAVIAWLLWKFVF